MILRFQQTRLKHYIICWDRLNSCYPEEFSKLIGCCQFNWRLTIVLEPLGVVNVVSKNSKIFLRIRI